MKENHKLPLRKEHRGAIDLKRVQRKSRMELNEIFVLYGIDPDSVKPSEIPYPLPDWSISREVEWKARFPRKQLNLQSTRNHKKQLSPARETNNASLDKESSSLLADPMVSFSEDEAAEQATAGKTKKKSPSRAFQKQTKSEQKSRHIYSLESLLSANHESIDEDDLMEAAKRALLSLDNETMKGLQIMLSSRGTGYPSVEKLMKQQQTKEYDGGSFLIVKSPDEGMYHCLDPETLVKFVQQSSFRQRDSKKSAGMSEDKQVAIPPSSTTQAEKVIFDV